MAEFENSKCMHKNMRQNNNMICSEVPIALTFGNVDPTFKDSEKNTCDIDFLNSGVQRKKQHQTSQTSGTRIFSLGLTIKVDVIVTWKTGQNWGPKRVKAEHF